jgi:tetratricopeptide (TPR) repeat protein
MTWLQISCPATCFVLSGLAILDAMRPGFILLLLSAAAALGQQPGPEAIFNRAMQDQQRGDYAAAILDYEEVLKLRPDKLEARANLAVALAHEGHYNEAITQYRRVLVAAPNDVGLLTDLGLAYYKNGNCKDASREFETVAKLQQPDGKLATLLGDCEVRLGQAAAAEKLLLPMEPANAADPDFEYTLGTAMIQGGHRLDGVARLETVAASTSNAEAYMQAGSTLIDLNRFPRAQTDLEAALRLNPNLPGIYTLLGMAKDMNGDATAAEPDLREAIRRNQDDFNANLYLGSILYKRHDLAEAKPYLDRAIRINPSSPTAQYEIAMWESTSSDYAAAAKDLERVEKANPDWLQPHVELAVVYYRLHRPDDGMREREIVDKIKAEEQQAGPPQIQAPQ